MRKWPKSLPDYQWPARYASRGWTAVRIAMAAIFHAAYAIGWIIGQADRRRHRALVIRTDGMGDGLLFEPALESLAQSISPLRLHLWAPRLTCQLLSRCPSVYRLMSIPRGFKQGNLSYFLSPIWRAKMGYSLGRWNFERVIYPAESPEPLGNWLFVSVRAKERWLNYGDTINQFDWQQSKTHQHATMLIENRPGSAHELLRNEYLAQQWSGQKSLRKPKMHLTEAIVLRAEQQEDAWRSQARRAGGSEIVGVIPAASMTINAYADEKWIDAIRQLWDEHRAVPVLLGGPDDSATIDRLATQLASIEVPHLRLPKPLKILDMAAMVAKLDGVLSVDTGLAHLAVTQGVPTVVLVGGGNPGRFFPWPKTKHHIALNVATPCAGCNNRCTEAEPICITHITPDEIAGAYAQLKGRRVSVQLQPAARQKPLKAVG